MIQNNSKPVGVTKDTGWQIGLRRTLPIPYEMLWELITSQAGVDIWLGKGAKVLFEKGATYQLDNDTTGEIRVIQPYSHFRITRLPPGKEYYRPSTIQVRVLEKGGKSELVFHEEHLPNQNERQARKTFYLESVDKIRRLIPQD